MTSPAVLPWPHRDLFPNSRKDRRHTTATRQAAKWDATIAAKEAGWLKIPPGPLTLHLEFAPPDNRRRDLDNMLSAVKYQIDALADVLGVDDSEFAYTLRKVQPVKGGRVTVRYEREQAPL